MLKTYIKPYRIRVAWNALIKMVGTLMEVVLPTILAYIVNTVVPARNQTRIILWGIIMIFCAFGAWLLNITANRMASKTASLAIKNIRRDLFNRSLTLSARQIDELGVSSLESRLTSDTYIVHRLLSVTLRMGIRSVMLFLGGVFFCLLLSPRLSLVLLALILPLVLVVRVIFRKAFPLFRQVQQMIDEMVQVIRENIRGIKVSKALDTTEFEQERFAQANDEVKNAEVKAIDQIAKMPPLVNFILFTGVALVLIYGARLVNINQIQTGTVMAFLSYFIQITNSLMGMNRMINIYNRAAASEKRISEVLSLPIDDNQIISDYQKQQLPARNYKVPEIEFRNVSFSYLGKKKNLNNISFKLYPGKTLGIMGATGSGKSTLIRLSLRQYDVDEGKILIRGVDVRKLSASDLLGLFGTVFQSDFLFGGTIRENIAFGRELTEEQINKASKHAQAADFIEEKEGLDFQLASKGVNLSGGQKQRLLLSRAFASEPDILILDDASSSLDFKTDQRLRQAIRVNFPLTTQIIIAQRVSSIRHAEQILLLDKGQIMALGTHEELLAECPEYKEIAETQMGTTSNIA
ncbi:MAG TPA: ABC transporter ATP-binding protein [Clostridiaceae bacterium]|nr:ABC transporter ATP-binding protein [Clostridiaceae bacterium]